MKWWSFATSALALGASGCGNSSPPVSPNTATETSQPVAIQAPPPESVEIVTGRSGGVPYVLVRNGGSTDIQINQVIANNLPGDQDCDQKSFDVLKAGDKKQFDFSRCGVIRSAKVITSKSEYSRDLNSPSDFIFAGEVSDGYSTFVRVSNDNPTPIRLNRAVINGRAGDSACDIKIFNDIASESYLDVPASTCGSPREVALSTSVGELNIKFADQ